jgi:hypothetical protein
MTSRLENVKGRDLGDPGINGYIILKSILGKKDTSMRIRFTALSDGLLCT